MIFKTQPDAHQIEALNAAGDLKEFALLMEQGTGKSKVVVDRCGSLYSDNKIDGALIIAPNGVHIDWVREQFATHWPDQYPLLARFYRSGSGKKESEHRRVVLTPTKEFRALTMNFEALRASGANEALEFLKSGKMMMVVDESSLIKTPSAKVTRVCWALGKIAQYRMILTGTEVTEGALDLYAQFQFLRPGALGSPNFSTFKARYAEWIERRVSSNGNSHTFRQLLRYKNLDELKRNVAALSYQVRRKDCLSLPPQIYERRSVVLRPEQMSVYNEVRARVLAEFDQGTITSAHEITRVMRLAQIAGGFMPLDDLEDGQRHPLPNAKLDALMEIVEATPPDEQIIVWARFRAELDAIASALEKHGGGVACWWGGVANRNEQADEFKAGTRRFMVAQQHAGGKGHTWIAGTTVVYFSNSWSYEDRKQSEDRSHRRGQTERVLYIDLVAIDTIDEKILKALKAKQDVAEFFKVSRELV